ncbi:aurora borealis [Pelobates cultripes]|uniref:Protein aurora borealis n=1 Tax=Pelobates cultripes TaxID=61616 RepID=A0AAD1VP35_PELCU|nr:aurora borealis [Pelobates cultripes]
MGDVRTHLTPETPGRTAILNPFESPSDYCSLHEPFVSSPTVFKPTKSSATPRQFKWSIDQLAAINPVEIDPEDIHRQALFFNHAKTDKDIEERRQKAIEEFFTKRTIVPSPWTQHEGKQAAQFHSTKCVDLMNESPIGRVQAIQSGRITVGCQTQLSLPIDFNLENVLGEYFRVDENADQSQENLSSASLRRKLFLDGQGSLSDSSYPPSPQTSCDVPAASLGVLCSLDLSPVRCRSPTQTPSSGQFSSSPIHGGKRAYSLGSNTSPTFFEQTPSRVMSPSFSPIAVQTAGCPHADQEKRLSFPSPETLSASKSMVNSCARSPYIEGCSPIKNPFQIRSRPCRGNSQYRTSLFQIPFTLDNQEEDKENSPPSSILSPERDVDLHFQTLDNYPFDAQLVQDSMPPVLPELQSCPQTCEELKDNDTVEMVDPVENEDPMWDKDVGVTENTPMTSFTNGITFSGESSHMCMSPLAESSVIPSESSSIQVDSGYTTQTYGSSIIDGIESTSKENSTPFHEHHQPQHCKVKVCNVSSIGTFV